jgi:hypothetical protein
MKKLSEFLFIVVGLSALNGPLFAHHGRGETFDMEKETTLQGPVTQVVWRNPHVLIYMDSEDENGNVVNWIFENSSVSGLAREGYHRNTVKTGQEITAIVHPARNGAATGIVVKIILEDGTEMMCREDCD